ncbi:MAG: 1-acyl-sn-glycerol-3-phosphate acyltransferase [Bacteroidota bacterium]
MIIKDKPIKFVQWLMLAAEKFILSKFSKIIFIDQPKVNQDVATLLLMNHFSFNDGPMMHYLCRKALKKEFKVMVLEEQMLLFKPLKYIGCFSVNKKSRTLVESLDYAASLLSEPKNMLGIFPQGGVFSSHLEKIHFEQGLDRILKKNKHEIQVVFAVMLLDFLADFKPKAYIYFMEYVGEQNPEEMEVTYNQFYTICKQKQKALYNPPAHVLH